MTRSRRQFVKLASTAAAASVVWPTRAVAGLQLTASAREALGIEERVGFDPGALAALALDAAKAAGASFADVRVDRFIWQSLGIANEHGGSVDFDDSVGIGVRVIANGQWGFVSSDAVTPDAVADAARRAVHQAQVNAKARTSAIELAPAPPVTGGRWATPVTIDPFGVPVGEQQEALLTGTRAALAVGGIMSAQASIAFLKVERYFASSEGSRIAQTFSLAFPGALVQGTAAGDAVMVSGEPKGFEWQAGGYEAVKNAKLPEIMRAAAEDVLRQSRERLAASRSVDVGRYELVVGPKMFWGMVGGTIVAALEMERVLGKETNGEGTSYAAPAEKVLGAMQMGAPFLTVHGDRSTRGGLMTVGWDDEGVKPDEYTLVDKGVFVDYLANRENATALASWYRARGVAPHAHGIAATGGWNAPVETVPNITVAPGAANVTVEDMIKDVKHGIYFPGSGGAGADFGLMNAYGYGGGAQEIRNGKLVGYLKDVAIQFAVQPFWKGLMAIGGTASVETFTDGYPGLFGCRTVRSVPARFKDVNVVNTGRTQ